MTRSMSRTIRLTLALALGSSLAAAPAVAQGKGKGKGRSGEGVPPGQMPPAGMCRIWIDGVPPGHQPAPTDCATAMWNRPSNARVLFGDDTKSRRSDDRYDRKDDRDNGDRDEDRNANDDRYERRRDQTVYDSQRTRPRIASPWLGRRLPLTSSDSYGNRPMPLMAAFNDQQAGRRTGDISRWFGSRTVNPRATDMNRDGTPERISWFDDGGRLVQVWTDSNRDGRADRVEIYQDGRRVQVVEH